MTKQVHFSPKKILHHELESICQDRERYKKWHGYNKNVKLSVRHSLLKARMKK